MSVTKDKRTGTYYYKFTRKGHPFYGPTGCTNERDARRVEEQKRREAEDWLNNQAQAMSAPMTIDIAIGRYWTEFGQYDSSTSFTYLKRLVEHFGPNTRIADIGDNDIAKLVAKRRDEGVSNATVNRATTELLRRVFRKAKEAWEQKLPNEPVWGNHLLSEPKERVRELSESEEKRIEAALRGDFGPIWRFSLLTGVRLAEAVNLRWSMVDWDGNVIRFVVKGNKPHVIPMTVAIRSLLGSLDGHHDTVVFTYQATRDIPHRDIVKGQRYPITYEGMKTRWRRDKAKAKITDFRWHDNRHTAGTRLLRATGNLRVVQNLLGHEDITTTTKYAHATLDDVRNAMEQAQSALPKSTEKSTEEKVDGAESLTP